MRKKALVTFAILAGLILVLLVSIKLNPAWRTRTYFALERGWSAHWRLSRGKYIPVRVQAAFRPFVPVRMEVEPGVNMLLDPEDVVPRTILETGEYEPGTWSVMKAHLPAGGTLVDVGAHIGYYSLKAARTVGPQGRVIAVEPNPETARKLRDNVQASRADIITVQPVACSDSESELKLFLAARRNSGETSLSRNNAEQSGDSGREYRVRARPLDAIIGEAGARRVDLVKIDVEGAELLVLKGATQTLARYSPTLILEIKDKQLQSMGTNAAEVMEFLRSQGYTPRHSIADNVEFAK